MGGAELIRLFVPGTDWNGNEAVLHWAIYYQDAGTYFYVKAEPKDIPASCYDWQVRWETSLPHGRDEWGQGRRRGVSN